jgi:hypothetical protein
MAVTSREATQELYSGGADGAILRWLPRFPRRVPVLPLTAGDRGTWRDDWDDVPEDERP